MSERTPTISIITVVFNGAATLAKCMDSVLTQTYEKIDYVVVDGNSTDGTMNIVQRNADRLGSWISEPDKGVYDAMNKGVRMAKGDWIYFLGADDVLASNTVIAEVVSSIKHDNEILYGNVVFTSSGREYDGYFNSFKIVTRNISHQALFYPRSVFDKTQFDTRYRIFADYDLNLRLFRSPSWKFEYMPVLVAFFNDRGLSGSQAIDAVFERNRMSIIRGNFPWIYVAYRQLRTALAKALKKAG